MDWLEITIYTRHEDVDFLIARLMDLGINGFEIEDAADFEEFLEENRAAWDYVDEELAREKRGETRVKIYLADNVSGRENLVAVREAAKGLKISVGSVSEEDWSENWKQFFHPLKIGHRVLVCPEWEEVSDSEGRIVFTINPGMSFGTGGHDTTQLCIQAIEEYIRQDAPMLDIGCGSGILSIIALLLGASRAVAIDVDENAVRIARENALKNDFGADVYRAYAGNVLENHMLISGKFPLIAANIVADVIIPLSAMVGDYLDEGGFFIASGIINSRSEEVREALERHFDIVETKEQSEWLCYVCRHKE